MIYSIRGFGGIPQQVILKLKVSLYFKIKVMWLSTHYACYPSLYLLLYFLGKSISTKKTSNFFTSLYLYIYTNCHTPRSIFTKILGYICNVCLILAFQFGLLYVFLYPSKLLYNFSKFTLP